jgi:DNA-directed RNA polymerase beta subunit
MNKRPSGKNVYMAIMTDENNQEDSLIMNQATIDLGKFSYLQYNNIFRNRLGYLAYLKVW